MRTPDYAAEVEHARRMVDAAIENIGPMEISEILPEELWSPEAIERITNLLPHFDPHLQAQVEDTYTQKGTTR